MEDKPLQRSEFNKRIQQLKDGTLKGLSLDESNPQPVDAGTGVTQELPRFHVDEGMGETAMTTEALDELKYFDMGDTKPIQVDSLAKISDKARSEGGELTKKQIAQAARAAGERAAKPASPHQPESLPEFDKD